MTTKQDLARQATESMAVRPTTAHPEGSEISRRNINWAVSFSLVSGDFATAQARRIRVGELAALTNPSEPTEVAQLSADLVLWLFLFDDAFGERSDLLESEHRTVMKSYEAVVLDNQLPKVSTPFHVALLDLITRAREMGATESWINRFATDLSEYFRGCVFETRYRTEGLVPGVDEYRKIRAATVGTRQVFAIGELGRCGVLDDAELDTEEVQEIRRVSALLTAWVNDMYSFPKEQDASDPLNLVIVLSHNYQLALPEALHEAAMVYNLDLDELNRMIENTRPHVSEGMNLYFDGLLDWIHGNRVWTKVCGRYV